MNVQVHVSPKHKVVGVPVRTDLCNLFPAAKRVTLGGNNLLLVRHGIDETKLLRNMGFTVPSPILSHYDWSGGTPFEIQKKTAALLTMNPRAYVLNGMGTGKTKASLWAWHYLYTRGEARKLLVVAPLSTLNFTWGREVFNTLPGVSVQVVYGTKQKRLQRLSDPSADVYIVNHDGLAIIEDALKLRDDIDTVILDELAVYRNGSATRSKVTRRVTARMRWAWGMTGSPTPNLPTDAWAQCTILTPNTVPKYFNRFRDETMVKITQFKWLPKPDALDRVYEVMQPAVRFTLEDVVELPEVVERTVDIELGPKQAKIYKQMEDHAHSLVAGQEITAVNAGVVLNKLLQISLGYVYTKDKQVAALDNDNRLDTIVDLVNATDRKVIVFAPFVHALAGIAKRLTSEGYDVRTISGDTPKGDREQAFNLFQNTDGVKVLVAHPQTMAHGLTLTAADTIIWAAPITSLETFLQANARIRRIGQNHKQQIIMLQGTKVEKRAYARLRAKEHVMNLLLDMFAEGTE
jgi:SNF2 family DNA or RNA helicase